ncbi:response regulator transcription factor [Nocardioides sp. zg-1228]|uniref:response regulator transcription factor n=1 Tax=Nocardioides sp. zg-1228 TaxID=2763008 RepID=UPI0021B51CF6|nr:LuxR C-terminal-related transcriptional regulator [Nocardioides sp. zg-1228]
MTITAIDRRRESPPGWGAVLSPRETEVLRLIAQGRTNAEIAADLFISVPTVKTHVAQLLRKVRARDRVALVVAAYTTGFVTPAAARPRLRCTAQRGHTPRR